MTNAPVTVASHALDMAQYYVNPYLLWGNSRAAKSMPSMRNIPSYSMKGSNTGRWTTSTKWSSWKQPYRRRNKRERGKGMKRAQFFIRNRMLMPEEIEGIMQGTMEIRKSHILDYDNNRMALLYKNRADEIHGRRLLEIEEDNWKELTYDIEEPEPKRHFPRV